MIAKKTVLSNLISAANKNRPAQLSTFRSYPIKRKTKSPQVRLTAQQQEAAYYARQQLRLRSFQETIDRARSEQAVLDIYGDKDNFVHIPDVGPDIEESYPLEKRKLDLSGQNDS